MEFKISASKFNIPNSKFMWARYLIIAFLFYLFALLQNSFFVHFNLLGLVPNLVFIFFFLLIFFEKGGISYAVIFYSVVAGIFLDIFLSSYLGVSLVLLITISLLAKKTQLLLKEKDDEYPFIYFLSLFLVYLIIYELLVMIYLRFFDPMHIQVVLDWRFFWGIIYNALFASVSFLIYKKIAGRFADNRQLSLFK